MIQSRGFYVSEKEVNCLVEKIDKDKDGRISYSEVSILNKFIHNDDIQLKTVIPVIDQSLMRN